MVQKYVLDWMSNTDLCFLGITQLSQHLIYGINFSIFKYVYMSLHQYSLTEPFGLEKTLGVSGLLHKAEPTLNSHHVVQGLVGS